MTPEQEEYAAYLRAHEGSHVVYREARGFSYVRLREVRIEKYGMGPPSSTSRSGGS